MMLSTPISNEQAAAFSCARNSGASYICLQGLDVNCDEM